jgi:hypothetical protein
MSTKLNADALAAKRWPEPKRRLSENLNALVDRIARQRGYAAAIREVAQPIADERDELREALQNIVDAMSKGSEEYPDRLETTNRYVEAVNILAKYPKP